MALTKFHALIEALKHAIGKEAITIVCYLVRFQINNQCIPYEPAI